MKTTKKNALAELSAYLAMYRDFHRDDDRVNDHILTKAQRIVAELAKVRCHAPFDEIPFDRDTNLAYRNCRAIAEEGVGVDMNKLVAKGAGNDK